MLKLLVHGLLDLLWPPRTTCLLCEQALAELEEAEQPHRVEGLVAESLPICLDCWAEMAFDPARLRCYACQRPLADGAGLCATCQTTRHFDQVWALGLHVGPLREAVHHLKFNGRKELGPPLGLRLAEGIDRWYDLILPMPLHPTRQRERGYNQAALIAEGIAEGMGRPMVLDQLVRIRSTGRQAKLDRQGRLRNLAGAFGVAGREGAIWEGRTVLLVDDVLTTGATAAAAADLLWETGATWVDLAVLAVSAKPVSTLGRRGAEGLDPSGFLG